MKFHLLLATLFIAIIAAGCSQNDNPKERKPLQEVYQNISGLSSQSIFAKTREVSNRNGIALPTITEADMQYLYSLTPEQLEDEKQRLYKKIGAQRFNMIEDRKAKNLAKKYELLGGHIGLQQLKTFTVAYLKGKGGWDEISKLLPLGLSRSQAETYVGVAIYIDRFARPFCLYIINQLQKTRNFAVTVWNEDSYSEGFCLAMLQDLFGGAGLNIDAGAFVAAMGNCDCDGASMDYELIDHDGTEIAFDAVEYWNQYQMCLKTPNHNGGE